MQYANAPGPSAAIAGQVVPTPDYYRFFVAVDRALRQLADDDGVPTIVAVDNVSSVVAYPCLVMRTGRVVSATGAFEADPVAGGGTFTSVRIPLLIPSNLADWYDLIGTASSFDASPAVYGDDTNDAAIVAWASGGTSPIEVYYSFKFLIRA